MQVKIMSDLHFEFGNTDLDPGHGDVLILAGDIVCAKHLGNNPSDSPQGSEYLRFFERASERFEHVLMVMGNHEHYNSNVDTSYERINRWLPDNFSLLEDQNTIIDGWTFVGSTLWTDCNRFDPITYQHLNVGMNDFLICRKKDGSMRFMAEDSAAKHQASRDYINYMASAAGANGKIFVITHHAPHEKSVAEKYKHDHIMNGGFRSDLSDMILDRPQIKYWVHGHMHNSSDYMIGDCRVIANPRGYPDRRGGFENLFFNPNLILEL